QFFTDEFLCSASFFQSLVDAGVLAEASVVELLQLVAQGQPFVPRLGVDGERAPAAHGEADDLSVAAWDGACVHVAIAELFHDPQLALGATLRGRVFAPSWYLGFASRAVVRCTHEGEEPNRDAPAQLGGQQTDRNRHGQGDTVPYEPLTGELG